MKPLHVIGAGGHAKVVVDAAVAAGYQVVALYDDDPAALGRTVLGVPVVGSPAALAGRGPLEALLAVGDNRARRALAERLAGVTWGCVVHPRAVVAPSARLGAGAVIFAGAVVQADAVLGAHAIVNTAATVDHDCLVGDFVHLGPGSHLCGSVSVGEGALVGVGASVVPGRAIGPWAVVGAGAAVAADVPAGAVARGVPARWQDPTPLRQRQGVP